MIVFTNPGVIDIRAMTTFGVSVKKSENPIGLFGTGFKYAIAVLLRNKQDIVVYAGESEIRFVLSQEQIRGQMFEIVCMQIDEDPPQSLGFTTELGKNWEMWMAFRELQCNCTDEAGESQKFPDKHGIWPHPDVTHIVVTGKAFEATYDDRHSYILEQKSYDLVSNNMSVTPGPTSRFYYKNVFVHTLGMKSLFTYNSLQALTLTEDRTLKNVWDVIHRVACCIMMSTDRKFIISCLTADKMYFEASLDYTLWTIEPSAEFIAVVGACIADKMFNINHSAVKVWERYCKKFAEPEMYEPSRTQQISLERALNFCDKVGYKIRGKYPVKIVKSLGSGGLGMAANDTIYIAVDVFTHGGTKLLASTLMEEFIHLDKGYSDESREMQNYLFDQVISLHEEILGEPL